MTDAWLSPSPLLLPLDLTDPIARPHRIKISTVVFSFRNLSSCSRLNHALGSSGISIRTTSNFRRNFRPCNFCSNPPPESDSSQIGKDSRNDLSLPNEDSNFQVETPVFFYPRTYAAIGTFSTFSSPSDTGGDTSENYQQQGEGVPPSAEQIPVICRELARYLITQDLNPDVALSMAERAHSLLQRTLKKAEEEEEAEKLLELLSLPDQGEAGDVSGAGNPPGGQRLAGPRAEGANSLQNLFDIASETTSQQEDNPMAAPAPIVKAEQDDEMPVQGDRQPEVTPRIAPDQGGVIGDMASGDVARVDVTSEGGASASQSGEGQQLRAPGVSSPEELAMKPLSAATPGDVLLKAEVYEKWAAKIARILHQDPRNGHLAVIESAGVRQVDLFRVTRRAEGRPVAEVAKTVSYIQHIMASMKPPPPGALGNDLMRMKQAFSLDASPDLIPVFAFIQRLEAMRGGVRQLEDPPIAAARLLEGFPELLKVDLEKSMMPLVNHLLEDWGLPWEDLGRVCLAYPPVLMLNWREEVLPTKHALKQAGVRVSDMGQMLKKFPWLLTSAAVRNVEPVVSCLRALKLPIGEIDRSVTRCPHLLGRDVEKSILPVAQALEAFGVKSKRLGKVLANSPQLLCRSVDKIHEVTNFLVQCGVSPDDMGHMLKRAPEIFASSVDSTLQRKVDFLLESQVAGNLIGRVLRFYPEYLLLNTNAMRTRLEFLHSKGIRQRHLSHMIYSYPPLLGYNIETVLAPKLQYLVEDMKRPISDLISFPKYFSYSLEKKIRRRASVAARRGVLDGYDLQKLLNSSDADFETQFFGLSHLLLPPDNSSPPEEGVR